MKKNRIPKEITGLIKKISADYNSQKIILFGSYAWGIPNKDSDIDLCVVERTVGNRRQRQLRLRRLLFGTRVPVDILSYTPNEIKDRLSFGDFFIKNIITKGTVLYERKKT